MVMTKKGDGIPNSRQSKVISENAAPIDGRIHTHHDDETLAYGDDLLFIRRGYCLPYSPVGVIHSGRRGQERGRPVAAGGCSGSFDEHGVQGLCVEHALRPRLQALRCSACELALDPGR
jgi:hypothetical protein